MADRPMIPPGLLAAVESDLEPVRPLASPARRALALLPLGLALLVAIPAFWGWRSNFSALGPAVAWGLSGLQALAGLLIVGAALREAIPGRELSGRALAATVSAALALFAGLTFATELVAPAAEGIGTTAHPVPSHCSEKGAPSPVELVKLPTAVHHLVETHETPANTESVAFVGAAASRMVPFPPFSEPAIAT